jgi:hypothetical protein
MKAKPTSEQERIFWKVADIGVKRGLVSTRQVAVICRLQPHRKTGYWKRHLQDLKAFMNWKAKRDQETESTGKGKVSTQASEGAVASDRAD